VGSAGIAELKERTHEVVRLDVELDLLAGEGSDSGGAVSAWVGGAGRGGGGVCT
jgi:hypothetical protein